MAVVGRTEGQADSSVAVLHEYLRAGLVGLARLNGSYAYALGRREQAMLVGCDAVGLRAPAYTWTGQTFLLTRVQLRCWAKSTGRPGTNCISRTL